MSLDANYNPYTPSQAPESVPTMAKGPLKGFAKVVCIFFIILGALGLLQAMQAAVGLTIMLAMESTPEQKALNGLNSFPGQMAVTILFAFINFAVSVCLLVGGVLGLKQKMSGAKLIRFTSAFMVIFKVVETVYAVVAGYFTMGTVKEQVIKQMRDDPKAPPMDMGLILDIGMYIGFALVVVMGLAMAIFYLFSFLNFSKQQTLSQFS